MSIGLRLDLRQSQQLVMTPQLQQAIKLLAMSNMELADFVQSEVEKNPLLELGSPEVLPDREDGPPPPVRTTDLVDGTPPAIDARVDDHALARDTFDTGTDHLHDTAPSDGPNPIYGAAGGGSGGGFDGVPFEDRLTEEPNLREHLRNQVGQIPAPEEISRTIARYLIEEIDEHGYLRTPLKDIAGRLEMPLDAVEEGLLLLQACEPTGVGARDVSECLALQLAEREPVNPEMRKLMEHMDLLAKGDLKRLQSICDVDAQTLGKMIAELRTLNPRPCAGYEAVQAQTVVPDIVLTRSDWGGWRIELNADTLPNVLIDRTYKAEFSGTDCAETKTYLADCQANASWLIKSLDQRARTILKVATEILRRQEKFFEGGISGLQPLTLKAVADAISMHESTVSRVTSNKYMATDRGIFELKFFFTNAVGGDDGDVAASAVRHRIKQLVQAEPANDIMSDDAIVDVLRKEGIDLARRTVAKYRKNLRIPSSVERRRLRALEQ
ncbi:MAG: RNA polymerase factor sigma-54 [Pseudomonadota bacterium]